MLERSQASGSGRKIAVVTGATSGIGEVAARRLASAGAIVVLVGRDPRRGEVTLERIRTLVPDARLDLVLGDLAEKDGVEAVGHEVAMRYPRIDVLINNAGGIFAHRELTSDRVERTWALNVRAPFRLTMALERSLRAAGYARVVNVASEAHRGQVLDFSNLEGQRSYSAWRAYGRSKLALLLLTFELARRWRGTGITVNAVHPGFVRTRFGLNNRGLFATGVRLASLLFARSAEHGADPLVYAAWDPELEGRTGLYLTHESPTAASEAALRPEDGARLLRILQQDGPAAA